MRVRRTALGLGILLVWVWMLGAHVRREYLMPDAARLAEAALSLNPGINFYTLTMNDRTVGQATSRLDTLPDGFELEILTFGTIKVVSDLAQVLQAQLTEVGIDTTVNVAELRAIACLRSPGRTSAGTKACKAGRLRA